MADVQLPGCKWYIEHWNILPQRVRSLRSRWYVWSLGDAWRNIRTSAQTVWQTFLHKKVVTKTNYFVLNNLRKKFQQRRLTSEREDPVLGMHQTLSGSSCCGSVKAEALALQVLLETPLILHPQSPVVGLDSDNCAVGLGLDYYVADPDWNGKMQKCNKIQKLTTLSANCIVKEFNIIIRKIYENGQQMK